MTESQAWLKVAEWLDQQTGFYRRLTSMCAAVRGVVADERLRARMNERIARYAQYYVMDEGEGGGLDCCGLSADAYVLAALYLSLEAK